MIRKTSAMVEAGILAAVAIVMALISMYVPVLGAFVNFVWPLPIVICGCRHGLKWSIMTLLVATVIIAMIISPINAFFLAAIFGLFGLDFRRVHATSSAADENDALRQRRRGNCAGAEYCAELLGTGY